MKKSVGENESFASFPIGNRVLVSWELIFWNRIDGWSGKRYLEMSDYYAWKPTGGQLKTPIMMVTKVSLNKDESVSWS